MNAWLTDIWRRTFTESMYGRETIDQRTNVESTCFGLVDTGTVGHRPFCRPGQLVDDRLVNGRLVNMDVWSIRMFGQHSI